MVESGVNNVDARYGGNEATIDGEPDSYAKSGVERSPRQPYYRGQSPTQDNIKYQNPFKRNK